MTTRRDFIKCSTLVAAASMPGMAKAAAPVLRPRTGTVLPVRAFYDPDLGPDNGFASTFRAQGIGTAAVELDPSRFWLMLEREREPIAGLTRSDIPFFFSQQTGVNALRLRMVRRIELAGPDRTSQGWAASRQLFHQSVEVADQILCGPAHVCQGRDLLRVVRGPGRDAGDSLIAWFAVPAGTVG